VVLVLNYKRIINYFFLGGEVELGAEWLRMHEVVEGALTGQKKTAVGPRQVVEEKG